MYMSIPPGGCGGLSCLGALPGNIEGTASALSTFLLLPAFTLYESLVKCAYEIDLKVHILLYEEKVRHPYIYTVYMRIADHLA